MADCGSGSPAASRAGPPAPPALTAEAGFVEVPARNVTVKGTPVTVAATGRFFYNLRPADVAPEGKPILVLFNGFAAEVVRSFGTGPMSVAEGGAVVPNPSSLTRFANLVYLEPREAGYSYDVVEGRGPLPDDCAPGVFNEYVDAADVLLATLAFLDAHPRLTGPVTWVGESYAGVRITWILAYLRGRWDLAPYADPTLEAALARSTHPGSLLAGQVLLEGWLAGSAHGAAIAAECLDPAQVADVSASTGQPCAAGDACQCANDQDRSLYNYTFTVERQDARETEGSAAHILPDRAAALLGVPLGSMPLLAAGERAKGWKCAAPDATVPAEDPLVAALGPLPAGQSYYVPYSPLQPGKETAPGTRDWQSRTLEGAAFVDNLRQVPAFVTRGARDLVVPPRALVPALRTLVGAGGVDESSPGRVGVTTPDGARFLDVFAYADAGHMITMIEPAEFAADLEAWLASR